MTQVVPKSREKHNQEPPNTHSDLRLDVFTGIFFSLWKSKFDLTKMTIPVLQGIRRYLVKQF